jgi:UDP-N-acetylmuramyl pentapeptide phosphotransferase/UDP-N-acetylglucosamine-1-phosphate transferase
MNLELIILILFIGCAISSALITWVAKILLTKYGRLDYPNERSNHQNPVPRGGGIAVIAVFLLVIISAGMYHGDIIWDYNKVWVSIIILAIISFIDDVRGVPVIIRLGSQFLIVSYLAFTDYAGISITGGYLPPMLDKVFMVLAWVWFINLFNFMDGIDGLAAAETVFIACALFLMAYTSQAGEIVAFFGAVIGGCMMGFLFWNWQPAKIFLGDVGSIPVGFILGWLLLELAAGGYYFQALIIPGYFLADTGITLIRRMFKGKRIWQAHSEHFYQLAVRAGLSHKQVVTEITLINIVLLAFCMLLDGLVAFIASICLLVFILRFFWVSREY